VNATPVNIETVTKGIKYEHILISVTIAHNRSIGQFDDSCAYQIEKHMKEYNGVLTVHADVMYAHCSEQNHVSECDCGRCQQVRENSKKEGKS